MKIKKVCLMAASLIVAGAAIATSACSSKANGGKLVVSTFGILTKQMRSDVLNPFAKKNNVKVSAQFTADTTTSLTQIEHNPNSSVDVIEVAQKNAYAGAKKKLYKKVDFSKIKDFKYLSSSEQKLAKDTGTVPYTVNSVGIIYNPKKVHITEWDQLWSKKLKGKIAIPDIVTTFGPAMLYIAGRHAKVDVPSDGGKAAFKAMKELKPNVVKTYDQSSDLTNMFKTGEISVAVVGDYAISMLQATNPELKYIVPASGTYSNSNVVAILKNSNNTDAAYKYINFRLSEAIQKRCASAKSLNNAPVNTQVKLTPAEAANKTYGDVAKRAKSMNFFYVNSHLSSWVNQWNKIMNR